MNRRNLLRFGALSGIAATGLGALVAKAAGADYKAVVCVFLNGGWDTNNVVVPTDGAGYGDYLAARRSLAIPKAALLPITTASGGSYGLHPNMPEVQALYAQGRVAILANVGTLVRPTTKVQAQSGTWPLPDNLMSHEDQQNLWASLSPATLSPLSGLSRTGWGGRLADALTTLNAGATFPPIVSTNGSNIFCDSDAAASTTVDTSGAFSLPLTGDASLDAARSAALLQLTGDAGGLTLQGVAAGALGAVITQAAQVQSAFAMPLTTVFPASDIGQQFYRVAQLIQARGTLGLSRQVFYVELGGFDTHSDQLATHVSLLGQLSQALASFYAATVELNVASSVTTFTHSDFSRTLKPAGDNGGGSDHAWGGHSLIIGGAVKGGDIYGTFPKLVLTGPDDATDEGRWVPTTSADQYAATIASWMGVSNSSLDMVLPNLANFGVRRLGFL